MLVATGLDTRAIVVDPEPTASQREQHRQTLETLMNHGVLVHADEFDERRFLVALGELPQGVRQLWEVALPRIVRRRADPPRPVAVGDAENRGELIDVWSPVTSVALIREQLAEDMGLGPEEASSVDDETGFEISKFSLTPGTRAFRALRELSQSEIPARSPRSEVWADRFAPLFQHFREVTIVDRYASEAMLPSRRRRGGFEWLLGALPQETRSRIHLITRSTGPSVSDIIRELRRMRRNTPGAAVAHLEATLATDSAFREYAHARHIRFGGHRVVTLDRGLTMFERESIRQSSPCLYGNAQDARRREREVISRSFASARRRAIT